LRHPPVTHEAYSIVPFNAGNVVRTCAEDALVTLDELAGGRRRGPCWAWRRSRERV